MNIRKVSPFDRQVSALIDSLDRYQSELYPAESNHLDSRQTLSADSCMLLGAFEGDELLGIGAAKITDGFAELKRFYVLPQARESVLPIRFARTRNLVENAGNQQNLSRDGNSPARSARLLQKVWLPPLRTFWLLQRGSAERFL